MYCSASSAASGWTTSSSEPDRKTAACSTASRRGSTPSSSGISGKTAAPSGTSDDSGGPALMSASGHGGDDGQRVAVLDRRIQVVQIADVLVVEVEIDEAARLAALEQPRPQG